MSTMSQSRAWAGPPVFSFGFRPFFLAGPVHAAFVMALWVPWYLGAIELPVAFEPIAWHVHELLFGYVLAVVAGFLLTAVPNWTGRLPVVGYPLIGLLSLWLLGRVAMMISSWLDPIVLVGFCVSFPIALLAMIGREVISANNINNFSIVLVLGFITIAQALMHLAEATGTEPVNAARLGVAAFITLIMVVGGRITPSFTLNWIKKANPGREPTPFGGYDLMALLGGATALALWVIAEQLPEFSYDCIGYMLIASGLVHLVRQARWAADRVLAEPIVIILHVAYGFVPMGFILSGLAFFDPVSVPAIAGVHAWSAGAIGVMTLAVMSRATLGHTGRELRASPVTNIIYAAVTLAALARVASALLPAYAILLLGASAALWCAGFAGFAMIYGPMLLTKRLKA